MQQLNIDADNRIQVSRFHYHCHRHAWYVAELVSKILDTIEGIGAARKNQYAAFVRDEGVLVVWADSVQKVVPSAQAIENSLVAFLWQEETDEYTISGTPVLGKYGHNGMASRSTFTVGSGGKTPLTSPSISNMTGSNEKFADALPVPDYDEKNVNEAGASVDVEDPLKAEMLANRKLRPVTLISPFVSGFAVATAVCLMCLGLRMYTFIKHPPSY